MRLWLDSSPFGFHCLFQVIRTIVQGKTLEGMMMQPFSGQELKRTNVELYKGMCLSIALPCLLRPSDKLCCRSLRHS